MDKVTTDLHSHSQWLTIVVFSVIVPFVHDKNYCLIAGLYQETTAIPLQLKLVSEGKLKRHQRKSSRQTQGRLFSLWDNCSNNILSASRLLKDCAGIYTPTCTYTVNRHVF